MVQGFVHVAGSVTVNSYLSVFGSASVKRSTRRMPAVDPCHLVSSVKLVVSTTSVLPSQWPRASPKYCRTFDGRCGRPSRGMMRTSLFDSWIHITYPGICTICDSVVTPPGTLGAASTPNRQRVYHPTDCTSVPPTPQHPRARRFCASGVRGGILPSGGSTMSDVRRFGRTGLCQASIPYSLQS